MKEYQVSIIIPIYKVPPKFLSRCIESAMNQTLIEVEIVLVDDGSPDDAGAMCDRYARQDERITVIHKENGGLSSARNAGVREAKGKYIIFLDGDDWIEKDCCETVYRIAEDSQSQIVMFGMTKDYKNESTPYKYSIKENYLYNHDECKVLQEQVLNYNSNIATAATKLISRGFLIENGLWHNEELKQGAEGIVFTFLLLGKIESAYFVNKALYHYTYNGESISSSYNEDTIKRVLNCFSYIKDEIDSGNKNEHVYDALRTRILYAVISTVISGFFNPDNGYSFSGGKSKCKEYLNQEIVADALEYSSQNGMSRARKIIVFMIKRHMFLALYCLGHIRKWEKNHR